MFRVLIVEDDSYLSSQLAALLSRHYRVDTASTVERAYEIIAQHRFELLLLDRLLPDGDSLELVPYIRECSPVTRIIVMSERSNVDARIEGLHQGADDYLPKPLSSTELLLKIKNLLQLERVPADDWLHVGLLKFNRLTGETFCGQKEIHLRPREAQILHCLLRFKNRVVTRDTIMRNVWGACDLPTNTTLDVYLRRLRMVLGATANYIKTVRGFGYLIRDPVVAYK